MYKNYLHTIDDKALLQQFYATQNNECIGVLLERYATLLFGTCMKYLKNDDWAKEAVQAIYVKVLQDVPKYQIDYFKSWLYMVAKNYCLQCLQQKKQVSPLPESDNSLNMVYEQCDVELLEQQDKYHQQLPLALNSLNSSQQVCIQLFFLQKMSYQDICIQTGYTLLQVKSYIQNGKRNLKIWFDKQVKK